MKAKMKITAILLATLLLTHSVFASDFVRVSENRLVKLSVRDANYLSFVCPQNITGEVRFRSTSDGSASVETNLIAKAADDEEGRRFLDMVEYDVEIEDKRLTVVIRTPRHTPWEGLDKSVVLSMDFRVPEDWGINIEGMLYSIDVEGPFRELNIDNDYGEIKARNIDGPVNIRTSYKAVVLNDIVGEVSVLNSSGAIRASDIDCRPRACRFETTNGKVTLDHVVGEVEVITSHRPIVLRNVDAGTGAVIVVNNYGEIRMSDVGGVLDVQTNYSRITGESIRFGPGSSKIMGGYAEIELSRIQLDACNLSVSNNYSDVTVQIDGENSTNFILTTDEGGSIHTRGMLITPTTVTRNSFEGITGEGRSSLEINVRGIGRIEVVGNSGVPR